MLDLAMLTNTMFEVAFYKTSKMMERLQRDLYKRLLRDYKVTWTSLQRRYDVVVQRRSHVAI